MGILNALSVDVEDWHHPELIRDRIGAGEVAPRVEQATRPILQLLAKYQVRATFFIVGEVARSAPDLVREIAAAGHEIGCHSMSHRPLWELTPDEFRRELAGFAEAMSGLPRARCRLSRADLLARSAHALGCAYPARVCL